MKNAYLSFICSAFVSLSIIFSGADLKGQSNYSWQKVASLPDSIACLSAAGMNGKIYVTGGSLDCNGAISTLYVYDPVLNSWSTATGMKSPKWFHTSAVCNDNLYTFSGGWFSINDENLVYDPLTDAWEEIAPMPTPRSSAGAATVNGKVYVIGGFNDDDQQTTNEMYDPANGTWTTKASMSEARVGFGVAVVNNKIYVVGGTDSPLFAYSSVEMYDPATDTWEFKSNMQRSRFGVGVAAAGGKIYAVGGTRSNMISAYSYAEVYDPLTDTWTYIDPIPTATQWGTACSLGNDLYVLGGENKCCMTYDDAYFLDIVYRWGQPEGLREQNDIAETSSLVIPNPCQSKTKIKFHLSDPGPFTILVLNSSGQVVKSLDDVMEQPGQVEAEIDLQEIPAGIYTYLLKSSASFSTGKLVKL